MQRSAKQCKGVHCVDLGESFPTSIYLQNLASIQPRTSPSKTTPDTPRPTPPPPLKPTLQSLYKYLRIAEISLFSKYQILPTYQILPIRKYKRKLSINCVIGARSASGSASDHDGHDDSPRVDSVCGSSQESSYVCPCLF